MLEDPETGRKKKGAAQSYLDHGRCMYCMLCVTSCPHGALDFDNEFEYAVFDRTKIGETF